MYGDTDAIRGLARGLRRLGDDIRWEADRLLARAEAVPWQGVAADAMRALARHRAGELRRTAGLHDDAAQALDDHADAVDRFVPPPSGHLDWLSVDLPGLDVPGLDLPDLPHLSDLPDLPDLDIPLIGRAA